MMITFRSSNWEIVIKQICGTLFQLNAMPLKTINMGNDLWLKFEGKKRKKKKKKEKEKKKIQFLFWCT